MNPEYKARIDAILDLVIRRASEAKRLAEELQGAVDALGRAYHVRDRDADLWAEHVCKLDDAGALVCECGEVLIGIEKIAEHKCDQMRRSA